MLGVGKSEPPIAQLTMQTNPPTPPESAPAVVEHASLLLSRACFILHKPICTLCSTVDRQPKPTGHEGGERSTASLAQPQRDNPGSCDSLARWQLW